MFRRKFVSQPVPCNDRGFLFFLCMPETKLQYGRTADDELTPSLCIIFLSI
jgi:hypothetical protein